MHASSIPIPPKADTIIDSETTVLEPEAPETAPAEAEPTPETSPAETPEPTPESSEPEPTEASEPNEEVEEGEEEGEPETVEAITESAPGDDLAQIVAAEIETGRAAIAHLQSHPLATSQGVIADAIQTLEPHIGNLEAALNEYRKASGK